MTPGEASALSAPRKQEAVGFTNQELCPTAALVECLEIWWTEVGPGRQQPPLRSRLQKTSTPPRGGSRRRGGAAETLPIGLARLLRGSAAPPVRSPNHKPRGDSPFPSHPVLRAQTASHGRQGRRGVGGRGQRGGVSGARAG